ncbi:hypothetical protein AAE478_001353 [Parahypoxylon ruwenzoriense]
MVGIPKSNRCTFCKLRKTKVSNLPSSSSPAFLSQLELRPLIKCDENWPTCGACARAGKVCSGARISYKFVVNGCHNEARITPSRDSDDAGTTASDSDRTQDTLSRRRASPGTTIIVDMKEYTTSLGPGTFHRMRLKRPYLHKRPDGNRSVPSPSPSPPLSPVMSPSDRLAAKFISCLESASGTGYDLLIWGPSIRMIPQRLGSESAVLRQAVELVVRSWTNSRRELMSELWLDLRMYTLALGSLQKALEEPEQGLVTDTVAAQALIQRVELTYDFERGANQENHAAGLTAVISRGGPWQIFSDLGLHITFDSFYNMLQEDVRLGRDSVFMNRDWHKAFTHAIESISIRPALKAMYRLWVEMTAWPTLVRLVRVFCRNPSDTMTAAELVLRVNPIIEYLEHESATTLSSLMRCGDIAEVENFFNPGLFPTCYRFRDIDTAKVFYIHAMCIIIVYRALQEANLVLEHHVPSVMKRCREYSKRIWMSYSWMRTQRPLAIEYTAALAFSYESANEEEREFCVRGLEDMEYFRRPPPIGRWLEATIMANVKGYTGRMPFIKTQDVSIELCGLGCRC